MTEEAKSGYTLAIASSKQKLIDEVNKLIAGGWVPQGGLSIEYPANAALPMYGQAMVKPDAV